MSTQPEQAKAEILQQIVATIHEKVPEDRRDQLEAFTRQYYHRLAPEDLLELEPEDLYGAVLAHWRLAQRRQPGEAKVRVYSPRFEEHGWRSKHSIVEIVTDDMPFLVDSVAMELNRHGLVIHLPIHPVIRVRRDEARGLLEWIEDHHFTFVGYRAYDLITEDGEDMLRPIQGTGLGILRQGQAK